MNRREDRETTDPVHVSRRRFLQGSAAAVAAASLPIVRAGTAAAGASCDPLTTPPSFMGTVPDSVVGARVRGGRRPRSDVRRDRDVPEHRRPREQPCGRGGRRRVGAGPRRALRDRGQPRERHRRRPRGDPAGDGAAARPVDPARDRRHPRYLDPRDPLGRREPARWRGERWRRIAAAALRARGPGRLRRDRHPRPRDRRDHPVPEPGRTRIRLPSQPVLVRPQPGPPRADAVRDRGEARPHGPVPAGRPDRPPRVRVLPLVLPAERRPRLSRDPRARRAADQRHLRAGLRARVPQPGLALLQRGVRVRPVRAAIHGHLRRHGVRSRGDDDRGVRRMRRSNFGSSGTSP